MLPPATTQVVIDLLAINDADLEDHQTYTLGLRIDRGFAQLGTSNTATITVPLNDVDKDKPLITVIFNTMQLTEGQATTLTITATQITEATTLSFTTAGPLDQPTNQYLLTFTQNQTTQITILASDDNQPSLIQSATITLNVDTNTQLPTNQFTLTITPDPTDQYQIGFAQDQLTLTEGTKQAITVIRTTPPTLSTATTITVNINNQNPDQLSLATTQITFNPLITTQVITLTAIDDKQAERQQTYPITISLAANTPAIITTPTLQLTIPTNDTPILTIRPTKLGIPKGQTGELTITANPPVTEIITITLSHDNQDQLTGIPPSITLRPGEAFYMFPITVNDIPENTPENTPPVTIMLNQVTGFAQIGEPKQATITIAPDGMRIRIRVFLEGALP